MSGEEVPLNPHVYEEICFICREALNYAFRHPSAQKVEVLVNFTRASFGVVIRDDGRGFQSSAIPSASPDGHWGIVGMRERAAGIGAKFDIRRAFPERIHPGTSVIIDIPATVAYAKSF